MSRMVPVRQAAPAVLFAMLTFSSFNIFTLNPNPNLHAGATSVVNAGLQNNHVSQTNRLSKVHIVDGNGDYRLSAMPNRGNAGGDIHPLHNLAAKGGSVMVGIGWKHRVGRFNF